MYSVFIASMFTGVLCSEKEKKIVNKQLKNVNKQLKIVNKKLKNQNKCTPLKPILALPI